MIILNLLADHVGNTGLWILASFFFNRSQDLLNGLPETFL
jgi:hypothetical protein